MLPGQLYRVAVVVAAILLLLVIIIIITTTIIIITITSELNLSYISKAVKLLFVIKHKILVKTETNLSRLFLERAP